MKFSYIGERLLLTLWVGSLLAIGYIAVPLAFMQLDVQTAGNYAGKLFQIVNIIGIVSASLMLINRLIIQNVRQFHRYWRNFILLIMLLISVAFVAYIQPEMQALKLLGLTSSDDVAHTFKLLHIISENLYLLLSLLGLMLVLTTDKRLEASDVDE